MFRGTVLDSFKATTAVIDNTEVQFRGYLGMETVPKLQDSGHLALGIL